MVQCKLNIKILQTMVSGFPLVMSLGTRVWDVYVSVIFRAAIMHRRRTLTMLFSATWTAQTDPRQSGPGSLITCGLMLYPFTLGCNPESQVGLRKTVGRRTLKAAVKLSGVGSAC